MPASALLERPAEIAEYYSEYPRVPVPVIGPSEPAALRERYLEGVGQPVIVKGAMSEWIASSKWSFSFFADTYGSRRHITNSNLNSTVGWQRLRFDDYLLYCVSPSLSPLGAKVSDKPFYSALPVIREFPELVADAPLARCVDNIYSKLNGPLADWYQNLFVWLFIGPSGTVTDFHVDHFMMHTYSAQLTGRKRFLFFSPACFRHLPFDAARKAERDSVEKPGLAYNDAVVVQEAVVGPGEMVVFPAGWGHHVVSLEPSISLSVNFVDSSNYLEHILSISRNLPTWAKRTRWPSFVEANRCTWNASDFSWLKEGQTA